MDGLLVNNLVLGNALDVLPTIASNSIGAVITDPPYASGGLHVGARSRDPREKYHRSDDPRPTFTGDHLDQRAWTSWCREWLSECARVLVPGGAVVVFIDWRQLASLTDAMQIAGFTLAGIGVWDKTPGGCRPRPGLRQQAEFIVWGSKGRFRFSQSDADTPYLPGVFSVHDRDRSKWHLTAKPVALCRKLVCLAAPGETVLDLFAGSGTTCLAAKLEGRGYYGIEVSPEIYGIAEGRLAG